jgi:glucose-6-phosphate-specific signal transduction histidine kinase
MGFDAEAPAGDGRRHYGLLGIRERAELVGGRARIESAPGKGTRVMVEVPLGGGGTQPPAGDSAAAAGENRPGEPSG